MISRISITGVLLLLLVLCGCNNDFPEGPKTGISLADTLSMTDIDLNMLLPVVIPNAGNQEWKMVQYPNWLWVDKKSGVLDNGRTTLKLTHNPNIVNYNFGYSYAPIIIYVKGIGYVEIPFVYGCFGRPTILYDSKSFDFSSVDRNTFTVNNNGYSGYFAWYILSKPDWLNVSATSGLVYADKSLDLVMTPNKTNMELGNYQGKVIIATNSTTGYIEFNVSMTLTQMIMGGTITPIAGNVIASEYNRSTDKMYILTKSPDKLIFVTGNTGEMKSLDLPYIPTCANYSEDGKNVIVGFTSNQLCNIDVDNNVITKTVPIDCSACSVVYGDNNWLYVATAETQKLRSVNLNTNQSIQTKFVLRGTPIIKKAAHHTTIYGTSPGYSASGLYVCDCSQGILKDSVDDYWIGVGNMWFSEDGNLIFYKEQSKAYFTPDYRFGKYISYDPGIAMKGKYSTSSGSINAVEYNSGSGLFWVGVGIFSANSEIYEFDATSFTQKRVFKVNSITDTNGQTVNATVYWIFSNKESTNLFLLKNNENSYSTPNWQLEKINL